MHVKVVNHCGRELSSANHGVEESQEALVETVAPFLDDNIVLTRQIVEAVVVKVTTKESGAAKKGAIEKFTPRSFNDLENDSFVGRLVSVIWMVVIPLRTLNSSHPDVQRIGKLSGGERMRLCFATVFADNPGLLLLDESTNHCDITLLEYMA
jgi:ABC-type glutathione transport system ATPase component